MASPLPGAALGGTETAVVLGLVMVILGARRDADGGALGATGRGLRAGSGRLWEMERMTKLLGVNSSNWSLDRLGL